jgi:hypothetical protein
VDLADLSAALAINTSLTSLGFVFHVYFFRSYVTSFFRLAQNMIVDVELLAKTLEGNSTLSFLKYRVTKDAIFSLRLTKSTCQLVQQSNWGFAVSFDCTKSQ